MRKLFQKGNFIRIAAVFFGVYFLFFSTVELIPSLVTTNLLFNVFYVDKVHSFIDFIIGCCGLLAALSGHRSSRLFFRFFGIFFIATIIISFFIDGEFALSKLNYADNIATFIIGVIFLLIGFSPIAKK